jgi:hypothetical protein
MRPFSVRLPKTFVSALLASIFSLAFIVSPYWTIPGSIAGKIMTFILTIGVGTVWALVSGENLDLRFHPKSWLLLAVALIGLIILNYRSLTIGIPWRGDEDHHIRQVLLLLESTQEWIAPDVFFIGLMGVAAFLYAAWKRPRWAIPIAGILITSIAIVYIRKNPFQTLGSDFLLRYPFVNYWFYALAPKIASLTANPYQEVLYRIIPILSTVGIVWVYIQSLTSAKTPIKLLLGLFLATIPILFYYSSIFYLELPAVLLMLIVCLNIKSLLEDDFNKIRQNPAWYALILIGFIKETTITFLFCFLICRLVVRFMHKKPGNRLQTPPEFTSSGKIERPILHYLKEELAVVFTTSIALFLYILFRSTLTTIRSFSPSLSSLWNIAVYQAIGQSLIEQFGILCLLFLGGCVLLLLKKEYSTVCFFLFTLFFIPFFHVLDGSAFAGYSRFNLFILPSLLAGSIPLIKYVTEKTKIITLLIALCVTIVANLLISPVYPDGSKKPFWGNYLVDTSEHYYPYREALSWLKETHRDDHILFAGLYYPYLFDFYIDQLHWAPHYKIVRYQKAYEVVSHDKAYDETYAVSQMLDTAGRFDIDLLVYHVLGEHIPKPGNTGYFKQERVFSNHAHTIVVYQRTK